MSKIYFDCTTGISGDMAFAALIHLGFENQKLNPEYLRNELKKLKIEDFTLEVDFITKYDIDGINVDLVTNLHPNKTGENHGHTHSHKDEGHTHCHSQRHNHRSLNEIKAIIQSSDLNLNVKSIALNIYKTIGQAEAVVHGTTLEDVHFHEVGRDSAILNIVGVAIAVDKMNIKEVYCSPVHDGQGFIECSHGKIPVPVPAVKELLKDSGIIMITEDINMEMVTPSGLGILKGLNAVSLEDIPREVLHIGYGFGKRDIGKLSAVKVYEFL